MLKRKVLDKLESWYKSGHKKAPLIFGARQVGKTYLIREFGKKEYKSFVEINFIKNQELKFVKI